MFKRDILIQAKRYTNKFLLIEIFIDCMETKKVSLTELLKQEYKELGLLNPEQQFLKMKHKKEHRRRMK